MNSQVPPILDFKTATMTILSILWSGIDKIKWTELANWIHKGWTCREDMKQVMEDHRLNNDSRCNLWWLGMQLRYNRLNEKRSLCRSLTQVTKNCSSTLSRWTQFSKSNEHSATVVQPNITTMAKTCRYTSKKMKTAVVSWEQPFTCQARIGPNM